MAEVNRPEVDYRYFNAVTPDFVRLTEDLDQELFVKLGEAQKAYHGFNRLAGINDVVLAYQGTEAVGCASFKDHDGTAAEVKRVFVRPEYRGRGISKELMARIEQRVLARGFQTILVETSRSFAAAVGLYRALGYQVIDNYPPYDAMAESICFWKALAP